MSDSNIFFENLQKYLICTGKHSVKVQISLDTENKNKLNKHMQEYGVCMVCEVS